MKLSIITTMYYSAPYIVEFYERVLKSAKTITNDYEIIFVNDGSLDNSLDIALNLRKKDKKVKIIDLSRNFGHHYAISAGLNYSLGEYVFLTDCDLEISPEILSEFYKKINDADVIYGYQEKRKGGFLEKKMGGVFWKIINRMGNVSIPQNVLTERLMKKKYVENLVSMGDKNLFLAGMMYWAGFKQVGIPIKKNQRKGKSTYSIIKRIKLAGEAISSFSITPLKIMFNFGLFVTLMSGIAGFYILIKKIMFPNEILMGYTSLMIIIFLSLGLIISSLGLIGIYISKIFIQTQNRPLYIVKNIFE